MSVDDLSKALKAAEGGKRILDENTMNLSQGGESIVGASEDQKVKKRKNSECGKRVKKRKLKGVVHSLHSFGEDIDQIKSEIDFMIEKLQLVLDEIKQLNKTITELKHHQMVLGMKIELCFEMIINDEPK